MSLAFTRQQTRTPAEPAPPPAGRGMIEIQPEPAAQPGLPGTRPLDLPGLDRVDRLRDQLRRTSPDFAALERHYAEPGLALRRFGLLAWEAGRLPVAAEAFTAALSLTPGEARLWRDLAFVFQALGRLGEASTCTRRSVDLEPADGASWLMLANLLHQQEELDGAEQAFRRAILCDGGLSDAHLALGLLLFGRRRLDEAALCFRTTLALVPAHPMAALCLGQVLYDGGDFAGSAEAFALAEGAMPLPAPARRNLARARAFTAMLSGHIAEALDEHRRAAGESAEEPASLLHVAFSLFSAGGHVAAAIAVGRFRLALEPDDPVQAYLLDALCGRPHDAAPIGYVERHFDAFAPSFDEKLVTVLRYRVPQQLAALAARHRHRFADIVDLGCGTGLAAAPLSAFAGRLTGVDIADRMLAEAGRRALYADLVKAEAIAFLGGAPGAFDLVFAADLLIYLGTLAPVFAAAAGALRPGGLFCLSIETTDRAPFVLLPSGRFAHARSYVLALAAPAFDVLDDVEQDLRLEGHAAVRGRLMVLERRG